MSNALQIAKIVILQHNVTHAIEGIISMKPNNVLYVKILIVMNAYHQAQANVPPVALAFFKTVNVILLAVTRIVPLAQGQASILAQHALLDIL